MDSYTNAKQCINADGIDRVKAQKRKSSQTLFFITPFFILGQIGTAYSKSIHSRSPNLIFIICFFFIILFVWLIFIPELKRIKQTSYVISCLEFQPGKLVIETFSSLGFKERKIIIEEHSFDLKNGSDEKNITLFKMDVIRINFKNSDFFLLKDYFDLSIINSLKKTALEKT